MNLALLLPDWNSLDSVRRAHSSLELCSIWLFAVLVVCDVIAHLIEDNHKATAKLLERFGLCCFALAVLAELGGYKYGERNDELSQAVITSLDTKAKNAFDNASAALIKSAGANTTADAADTTAGRALGKANAAESQIAKVGTAVDVAKKDVAELQARLAWRIISDDQKIKLRDRLTHFRGRTVLVEWSGSDPEQDAFASQLIDALQSAGLDVRPQGSGMAMVFGTESVLGLMLLGNDRSFANVLSVALGCSYIATLPVSYKETPLPDGTVTVLIKQKGNPVDRAAADAKCKSLPNFP